MTIRTITVEFPYATDEGFEYQVSAQVEIDAPDSYTMVHATGCDDVSDHVYSCIKQKAEEVAWEQEHRPRNSRTGCDCLPTVAGTTAHVHGCAIGRREEERRERRLFGFQSNYDFVQRRALDANTEIYLNRK